MHELDRHGELDVMEAAVAAHARGSHSEHGPDALAARIDEMPRQFRDEFNMRMRAPSTASLTFPISASASLMSGSRLAERSSLPSNGMTTPTIRP